jgi:hypothetical protein
MPKVLKRVMAGKVSIPRNEKGFATVSLPKGATIEDGVQAQVDKVFLTWTGPPWPEGYTKDEIEDHYLALTPVDKPIPTHGQRYQMLGSFTNTHLEEKNPQKEIFVFELFK